MKLTVHAEGWPDAAALLVGIPVAVCMWLGRFGAAETIVGALGSSVAAWMGVKKYLLTDRAGAGLLSFAYWTLVFLLLLLVIRYARLVADLGLADTGLNGGA